MQSSLGPMGKAPTARLRERWGRQLGQVYPWRRGNKADTYGPLTTCSQHGTCVSSAQLHRTREPLTLQRRELRPRLLTPTSQVPPTRRDGCTVAPACPHSPQPAFRLIGSLAWPGE